MARIRMPNARPALPPQEVKPEPDHPWGDTPINKGFRTYLISSGQAYALRRAFGKRKIGKGA